ncbi:hypothetical protein P7K49_018515 [Saguinus oedipus]|uniref:Uncharacterized protein n=1 Tax=Saguinus oedipus TaxID=9490 RepID=A0ABQ9V5K5_SAGOE|nr:hypothetical protein P7K49_018515 [Saguinus oedipus]
MMGGPQLTTADTGRWRGGSELQGKQGHAAVVAKDRTEPGQERHSARDQWWYELRGW